MQTYGYLQEFYMKWWRTGKKCEVLDDKEGSTSELALGQIGGLFIIGMVLFLFFDIASFICKLKFWAKVSCGLLLATAIVALEFTWKTIKTSQNTVTKKLS